MAKINTIRGCLLISLPTQLNGQFYFFQASCQLLREGVGGVAQHPAQVGLRSRPQVSPRRRPRRRQEEGARGW